MTKRDPKRKKKNQWKKNREARKKCCNAKNSARGKESLQLSLTTRASAHRRKEQSLKLP